MLRAMVCSRASSYSDLPTSSAGAAGAGAWACSAAGIVTVADLDCFGGLDSAFDSAARLFFFGVLTAAVLLRAFKSLMIALAFQPRFSRGLKRRRRAKHGARR